MSRRSQRPISVRNGRLRLSKPSKSVLRAPSFLGVRLRSGRRFSTCRIIRSCRSSPRPGCSRSATWLPLGRAIRARSCSSSRACPRPRREPSFTRRLTIPSMIQPTGWWPGSPVALSATWRLCPATWWSARPSSAERCSTASPCCPSAVVLATASASSARRRTVFGNREPQWPFRGRASHRRSTNSAGASSAVILRRLVGRPTSSRGSSRRRSATASP